MDDSLDSTTKPEEGGLRFGVRSACVAVLLVWTLSLALAVLPAALSQWTLYNRSGLCLPLLASSRHFALHAAYYTTVHCVLPLLTSVLIAVSHVAGYVKVSAMLLCCRPPDMLKFGMLSGTAAMQCARCFLSGVMALAGVGDGSVPADSKVISLLAIFSWPLTAVLTARLYVVRRWRQNKALAQ
jgi:hypothetical protein